MGNDESEIYGFHTGLPVQLAIYSGTRACSGIAVLDASKFSGRQLFEHEWKWKGSFAASPGAQEQVRSGPACEPLRVPYVLVTDLDHFTTQLLAHSVI